MCLRTFKNKRFKLSNELRLYIQNHDFKNGKKYFHGLIGMSLFGKKFLKWIFIFSLKARRTTLRTGIIHGTDSRHQYRTGHRYTLS